MAQALGAGLSGFSVEVVIPNLKLITGDLPEALLAVVPINPANRAVAVGLIE